jgi:hypothetical protein
MRTTHSGPLESESPSTKPPPICRAALDRSIYAANHGREANSSAGWRRESCLVESEMNRV